MIDHVAIKVSDVEKSRVFYEKAFAPLGHSVAFGSKGFVAFDIGKGLFELWEYKKEISPTHIAFLTKGKQEVEAFFKAALEAGGKDHGKPGPRPEYTHDYYACFVLDPDGHNIEAMWDKYDYT